MVMNVSEFEGKVMEATNDEPWCVPRPSPCARAGLIAGAQGCELDAHAGHRAGVRTALHYRERGELTARRTFNL
jgi:hypothetical protein